MTIKLSVILTPNEIYLAMHGKSKVVSRKLEEIPIRFLNQLKKELEDRRLFKVLKQPLYIAGTVYCYKEDPLFKWWEKA